MDKYSSLLYPFLSYEENETLLIWSQNPNLDRNKFVTIFVNTTATSVFNARVK
jgi:hypothetical protein